MTKWLILVGVMIIACIVEWIREIVTFKVTHYYVQSGKLNEMNRERRIVFLSDLHNNRYGRNNEKLLTAVKEQNPDLILIGGDMIVAKSSVSTRISEDLCKKLTEICPVYYANGNHEQRMKIYPETYRTKYQEYKKVLINSGVRFLENEHVDLMWDHCLVQISGLEIPREGYKKFQKTTLSLEQMTECLGHVDANKYQILLAHNPIYMDTYLEWGSDLVLSGHLHGGVVRIPGIGGMITPQFHMFPKYSGELTEHDNKTVIVSKGLGTHTVKVRFLNPAELIVLHINGNAI